MNWGHKITITFILFAALIITMVVISFQQEVHLVAPDYYEEELAYQDQIDKMQNYHDLVQKPSLSLVNQEIVLIFPPDMVVSQGQVHFYRPSHSGLDKSVEIHLDSNNQQRFAQSDFHKGLWKAKLSWKGGEKEFFVENSIVL
ncbi:FixH family protein [Reichenbachiella agarivorans]|uniref:FixH family protein n=1 Tax=Reichenbachiella agarivorans TaxID=2979464 RepID=A0ABY6CLM5_9BACT|nr:FixH family protein [Reichenbachiella agarivorans]UXP31421.1 FixH family protein [Reichenbachiella agarivorans]